MRLRRGRCSPGRRQGGPRRPQSPSPRPEAVLNRNAVAAPHYLSAEAGRHILLNGGNAVDAAIAMVATQGVVAPETCGLGGDLFAIVHRSATSIPAALNASGRAGSNASASMLRDLGHETVPRDHPLTVTIPGCVDGLIALAERFGSQSLSRVLEPAITAAREGFPVSSEQARAFATMVDVYVDNPAVSSFYPDREPVTAGDVVTRADLARTLESVAAGGREAFYQGEPGADIVSALEGFVTAEDLEANQAEWVDPINVTVGQDTAWMVPPNSAGYLGPGTLAVFARLDPPD
ncbi:MAG: gamma-glutamyltransferase, partial [Acidimicrobiia bacterium]|nr:gamma-glutamyltransferase [Acidimicrobiia bacterium]